VLRIKLKEWGKRYLPGEIIGTVTAVGAAYLAHVVYKNPLIVAYAGSIGESIGFYSTVILQNLMDANNKCKSENRNFLFSDFRKIVASIAIEFGPAGLIDDLLIRPFFMFVFPILLNNFLLGILIGKFVGDFTFYILVIMSYEFKQWHMKKKMLK
jgi:hypothetical protein